jgi:hypothetical protein
LNLAKNQEYNWITNRKFTIMKRSWNSDGLQFYQYQQKEQWPLTLTHWTQITGLYMYYHWRSSYLEGRIVIPLTGLPHQFKPWISKVVCCVLFWFVFSELRSEVIVPKKMNDNINMVSTIAGSMNGIEGLNLWKYINSFLTTKWPNDFNGKMYKKDLNLCCK